MKKSSSIAAIFCMFALLCGCTNAAYSTNGNGSDGSSPVLSDSPADTSSENTDSLSSDMSSIDTSLSTSGNSEPQGVNIGGGMVMFGTAVDSTELEEFSLAAYTEGYTFGEVENEFLDTLDNADIKELYMNAQILCKLLSTSAIRPTSKVLDNGHTRAQICFDGCMYGESGYTYESFKKAYLSAFTNEATEKILQDQYYLDYNGALFYVYGASGGNALKVHREYELISKTDSAVEFQCIVFSHDIDFKPSTEYDPALRDKYDKNIIDFKLVLTDNGWRAEKFLKADNHDEFLII